MLSKFSIHDVDFFLSIFTIPNSQCFSDWIWWCFVFGLRPVCCLWFDAVQQTITSDDIAPEMILSFNKLTHEDLFCLGMAFHLVLQLDL